FGNYNAMTLVQWRNEVNHISQRLGDVRDSSTTIGAWARVYGYDSSYDDNVSIDFKANLIQAGGDYRINNTWLVGGAFSYTDGEGKFSNGSADSDGYSLAAYLSGFFDCGAYVDFVGRIGRLSTDITAYSDASEFKGSYNNTTFGLSAEVGYHWKLNDTFYVEPQAELAYGFVKGDDFTGANDVRVEQDDFQTLVGRLGARIGASFADGAGTVYAHASVNHDFLGDADYTASLDSASRDLSVDIGGTWVSYGIGAQFNTTKNLNFYGTLERANGSEYQEDYRYSVGMSYRF
uniref:autotransporter outer membrane beta-barrel domain-containing protein n=1 Tax=Sutterella wadsworthensis TaxID=40545 RepID=UPI0039676446